MKMYNLMKRKINFKRVKWVPFKTDRFLTINEFTERRDIKHDILIWITRGLLTLSTWWHRQMSKITSVKQMKTICYTKIGQGARGVGWVTRKDGRVEKRLSETIGWLLENDGTALLILPNKLNLHN